MDKEKFFQLLKSRDIPEDRFEKVWEAASQFEAYLEEQGKLDSPTAAAVNAYSQKLIAAGNNQWDNYFSVAQYARYRQNNEMLVAIIELVDGSEVMDNLHAVLGKEVGEAIRDEVFAGIELPPFGTASAVKPPLTQKVMERFEALVDTDTRDKILSACLRSLPEEMHAKARKDYLKSESLEAFLQAKGDAFIAELEELRDENKLYFTQPITDEVIEFVERTPEIRQGRLEGDLIYEAKIPYMTVEYLAETDPQMKRYYYCHCPWVREAIPTGEVEISPEFCKCSAGFHAKYWEAAFAQPLKVEVVETVLKGDPWCKFAIHLPQEAKVL
jgi:hypothetical protein